MQNPGVNPSEHSGPYTACVWYAGLYIARAFDPKVPATKAEMLALAAAGGCPNGESGNFTKLTAAMKARYGLVGTITDHQGGPAAVAAVSSAVRAAVAGKYPIAVGLAGDGFNLTPHYQSNHFGHAIAVLYENGAPGIQLDPLAPAGSMGNSFDGAELTKFATAAIIFKATPPPPPAPKTYTQAELDAAVAAAVAAVPKGYSEEDLRAAKKVAADIVSRAASNEASKF